MKLGQAIRTLRKERFDETLQQFADRAGLDASHVSNVETGRKKPTFEYLTKSAVALGVPVVVIFLKSFEESDMPESKKHLLAEFDTLAEEVMNE